MISSQSQVVLLGSPPLVSLSSFPDLDNRRKAENTHVHVGYSFPLPAFAGTAPHGHNKAQDRDRMHAEDRNLTAPWPLSKEKRSH